MAQGRLAGFRLIWTPSWTRIGKLRPPKLAALEDVLRGLGGLVSARLTNSAHLKAMSPWTSHLARAIYPALIRERAVTLPRPRVRTMSRNVFLAITGDRIPPGIPLGAYSWRHRIRLIRRPPCPRSQIPPSVWVVNLCLMPTLRNAPAPIRRRTKVWVRMMETSAIAFECHCTDSTAALSRQPPSTLGGPSLIPSNDPPLAVTFPMGASPLRPQNATARISFAKRPKMPALPSCSAR